MLIFSIKENKSAPVKLLFIYTKSYFIICKRDILYYYYYEMILKLVIKIPSQQDLLQVINWATIYIVSSCRLEKPDEHLVKLNPEFAIYANDTIIVDNKCHDANKSFLFYFNYLLFVFIAHNCKVKKIKKKELMGRGECKLIAVLDWLINCWASFLAVLWFILYLSNV